MFINVYLIIMFMSVCNVGRDTVKKYMTVLRVQSFFLRILYEKTLIECGGQ